MSRQLTSLIRSLGVKSRAISDLIPNPRNPRRHNKRHIQQIATSIREFRVFVPILIDQDDQVLDGHARLEAARIIGLKRVPTIRIEHMTRGQLRTFALAINRLAELAQWDADVLALELTELSSLDLGFDLEITGFEIAEIDSYVEMGNQKATESAADELSGPTPNSAPTSKHGDLWILGPHKILCASALERRSYVALMQDERARLVFTDPPYNLPIDGHVSGLGRKKHKNFAMASGEMSSREFTEFLAKALSHLGAACLDGAVLFACMDWRHMFELLAASHAAKLELLNLCVWNKDNGGMGSLYRSKHELVFVFKSGRSPHLNAVQLGRYGRYRTNVWDYAGANSFRSDRNEDLERHPTVKPAAMIADAIKDCSRRGEIVLDAFAGSGTTIIGAEKTGRRAYTIEIDPGYVDTAVRRWEKFTGGTAVHATTGRTFAEVEVDAQPKTAAQ